MTTQATTADEYTVTEIREYLASVGSPVHHLHDDDVALASIDTCIRIIGAVEPGHPGRDADLVAAAAESLFTWLSDYGVTSDGDEITVQA